jgi:hypothetical protein
MVMFVFVRVAADLHVATAETASTFFAHKIVNMFGRACHSVRRFCLAPAPARTE